MYRRSKKPVAPYIFIVSLNKKSLYGRLYIKKKSNKKITSKLIKINQIIVKKKTTFVFILILFNVQRSNPILKIKVGTLYN